MKLQTKIVFKMNLTTQLMMEKRKTQTNIFRILMFVAIHKDFTFFEVVSI